MSSQRPLAVGSVPCIPGAAVDPSSLCSVAAVAAALALPPGPIVPLCEGITNRLFKVADSHLIRVYGRRTSALVNRTTELRLMVHLAACGLAPPPLARFANGLVYPFMPGAPCSPSDLAADGVWPLIARHLARWHTLPLLPCLSPSGDCVCVDERAGAVDSGAAPSSLEALPSSGDSSHCGGGALAARRRCALPKYIETMQTWLSLIPDSVFANSPPAYNISRPRLEAALTFAEANCMPAAENTPIVLTHNDLLSGNIIVMPAGDEVRFIDFEYGGPGYAAFDIANHFSEWAGFDCDWTRVPTVDRQREWIREYLVALSSMNTADSSSCTPCDETASANCDSLLLDVRRCTPAVHLFWTIWALLQSALSEIDFDYLSYASLRLQRFDKLIETATVASSSSSVTLFESLPDATSVISNCTSSFPSNSTDFLNSSTDNCRDRGMNNNYRQNDGSDVDNKFCST